MMQQLYTLLHGNQFLSTALLLSAVGATLVYLKGIPRYIYQKITNRVVYTATIYQTDKLFNDFECWFFSRYKEKYRNVEAYINSGDYGAPTEPNASKKEAKINYRQSEGIFFIRYHGALLRVRKGREKLEHATDVRSVYFNQYHISGIYARDKVDALLKEAVVFANVKSKEDEVIIYNHDACGWWQKSGTVSSKNISNVILNKTTKEDILKDLDLFVSERDWYVKASIMYKRGYLFHGSPGNGKTSLALAIASYLKRDIHCLDFNVLVDNAALRNSFSQLSSNSILLIEDIDGFFKQRKSVNSSSKISFSTFLNCLDGSHYKDGLITIITTNIIDSIDPALMRTGRMDKKICIGSPTIREVNSYLTVFYGQDFKIEQYYNHKSMSDVQEICLKNKSNPQEALLELSTERRV